MNRRSQAAMTPEERDAFLASERTIILCTNGPHGYPHAVAMWYSVDGDGNIWMTTYGKSQKAVNIRRNPKVALHVESGETYDTLKGVLVLGDAELISDEEQVLKFFVRIQEKMMGAMPDGFEEALRHQARKRVLIKVAPKRYSSWDHAKLGGAY